MRQGRYRLGVLEGDGIGAEIVPASVAVADAALATAGEPGVEWVPLPVGASAIEEHGAATPETTLAALAELDGWLLGPHDSAAYPEPHRSTLNPSGAIRKRFDLFANIRPAKAFEGARGIALDTDLVVVRENTQGFYADRNTYAGTGEYMPTPDVAIAMGIITRPAVERVARTAFELAMRRRRHVTIVHKANVLRLTTGLFRDVCREVAREFAEVAVDDFHIDAMTVHLLRRPAEFDVIVTENMFGDILSDLTAELAGSLGIASSLNASNDRAMAQAAHGAAPDIAGRGVANPISMMLSTALLLEWLGARHDDEALGRAARLIEQGVADAVRSGVSTRDLGGTASTRDFTATVLDAIDSPRVPGDGVAAQPVVLRPGELTPLHRGGGVRTVHLVTGAIATQFLNGTTEFDPGASLPLHSHDCEESVVVLEGRAAFEADGEVIELAAGDTTWVPAGVVHRFFNRGEGPMRILWTYGSATAERTMAATGETFPIGSPADRGGS